LRHVLLGNCIRTRAQHQHADVSGCRALGYNEPEDWHYPVRQILGAVQLEAGKPVDAERSYREELAHHAENGWSLFGLQQSLRAQGRTAEASAVGQRLTRAWANADT
jgi:hypothetical protein